MDTAEASRQKRLAPGDATCYATAMRSDEEFREAGWTRPTIRLDALATAALAALVGRLGPERSAVVRRVLVERCLAELGEIPPLPKKTTRPKKKDR